MVFLKIIVLAGLVRLLMETRNFLLCAGIYAGLAAVLTLVAGHGFVPALTVGAIGFVGATVYFWLLYQLEDTFFLWWFVFIGGLAIGLV